MLKSRNPIRSFPSNFAIISPELISQCYQTVFFIIIFVIIPLVSLNAQVIHRIYFERFPHYAVDDWITYAPATDITSIDIGDEHAYFGTQNGGILRYHLYNNSWDYPITTSNGLSSNRIRKVIYDYKGNTLVVETDKGIDTYNRGFDYWHPAYSDELPERQHPSEIEIADFKKRHNFRFPPYYRPSLSELPAFFTDRDFLFRPPDEILDPFNRIFRLNPERVTDNFQRLWVSTDGLGVGRVTLNNYFLNIETQSLPNITCRDIFMDNAGAWVGGLTRGKEPAGIARWDFQDNTWRYFESRMTNGIYSDNVFATTGTERFQFFATDNGLVRFDKTKESWQTFTTANWIQLPGNGVLLQESAVKSAARFMTSPLRKDLSGLRQRMDCFGTIKSVNTGIFIQWKTDSLITVCII